MAVRRVAAYTPEQVRRLQQQVRLRDHNRCVVHGTAGAEVHELLQRSSGRTRSVAIFRIEHMACVCSVCHYAIHHGSDKRRINRQIYIVLISRFGYEYDKKTVEFYQLEMT